MIRRRQILAGAVAIVGVVIFALLPPRTRTTTAPPASTVRGAFHIHSRRSDGSGTIDEIAAAAARAGLQFIIVTDHGDGTRAVEAPSYRSGVLTIDGVELNTSGGHYAVIGMPQTPYPFAGEPDAVMEDVARLGGFGFAAHPGSPRASLAWKDWASPFDGLEWINGDSEWRDEDRLPIARTLITYLFRSPQSMSLLLDRPSAVLDDWDRLTQTRPVPAIAAIDAHARLGFQQRTDPDTSWLHLPLPGYEASFRTFSNHVMLPAPLAGDAARDARLVIDAIRAGHMYSVVDAIATPGALVFTATSGSQQAMTGDTLTPRGDVLLHAAAAATPGTTLVLLKNGQRIHEVTDGPLETNGGPDRAVYRVEAYVAGRPVPWILSNPIYVGITPPPRAAAVAAPISRIPARTAEAATEAGANDTSRLEIGSPADTRARTFAGDPGITWSFALAPGAAAGQFAAVPIPVSPGLDAFERVRFTVSSPAPLRAWVQLRAIGNTERWGATFYADSQPRMIDIPFAKFRPIGVTSSVEPPLAKVAFLLFVVDTVNFRPGATGKMTISDVGFVK